MNCNEIEDRQLTTDSPQIRKILWLHTLSRVQVISSTKPRNEQTTGLAGRKVAYFGAYGAQGHLQTLPSQCAPINYKSSEILAVAWQHTTWIMIRTSDLGPSPTYNSQQLSEPRYYLQVTVKELCHVMWRGFLRSALDRVTVTIHPSLAFLVFSHIFCFSVVRNEYYTGQVSLIILLTETRCLALRLIRLSAASWNKKKLL